MQKFNLPDSLFPYQKEDLNRLLNTDYSFCILSEMGTGKTPIAIGLSQLGGYSKTLIICPNSLQLEWRRQIEEWTGITAAVSKKSSYYRRLQPLFDDFLGKDGNPFFITNYETLRIARHRDILERYPFDLVIMDEAHKIRNPNTALAKGILSFLSIRKDSRVLAMTGSPIVNNPADLHTILIAVKPDKYSKFTRMDFINDYCKFWRTRYGIKVYGSKNLEVLREKTAPFTIRRTKKEVLPYLPDKYYRKVLLEMDDDQREIYRKMEDELWVLLDSGEKLWAPSVLAQLTRLRQLNLEPNIVGISASSAKTSFIKELLEDSDDKFVIFSCFEKYIMYLHYKLPQKHIVITGDTKIEDRARLVKEFQEDDSIKLALGTTQCMGEGITLTSASNVIMTDRWWSPAVNTQAEDRLHRIGAKSAVMVILPVIEDSIDESFDKVLEGKKKFSSDFFDEKDVMNETVEDLRRSRGSKVPDQEEDREEQEFKGEIPTWMDMKEGESDGNR